MGAALAVAALLCAANGVSTPLDLAPMVRGAAAASFDPAAAARVEGAELHLRLLGANEEPVDRLGLYGILPVGPLTLELGHDWVAPRDSAHRRLSCGLAFTFEDAVTIGVAYRRVRATRGVVENATQWDLALVAEPVSWLALSAAVDAVNRPLFQATSNAPIYRAGLGVRPLAGAPWLTLGTEVAVRSRASAVAQPTLLVDLTPREGLHARVAYTPRDGQLWLGLELGLYGVSVAGTAAASRFGEHDRPSPAYGTSLTARSDMRDSVAAPAGRVVELALVGDLIAEPDGFALQRPSVATAALRLSELVHDPSVAEVILPVGALDVGLASIDELRQAIDALRDAGKRVVVELGNADESAYLIAAAADTIRMDTAASLTIDGFAVRQVYLADTLASIGVRFDAVAIGRFKSAPDALTRTEPGPENAEVQGALLAEARMSLERALTVERGLSAVDAAGVLATGLFTAVEAQRRGLVDELTQPTDVRAPPRARAQGQPATLQTTTPRRWGARPVIAVVPVVGTLAVQEGDNPLPGTTAAATVLVSAIETLRADPAVRAVVLRVDSPGGDVVAADLVWRAVRRLQAVKPVVVSMGDVAASGGYYVAAPGDLIIAEPNTVTGSIGIFSLHLDFSGLLERARVHTKVYTTDAEADWQMSHRGLSAEGRQRLRHNLEQYYEDFLQKVAVGRRLPMERVRALAEGRVYTGREALALGLVDAIGSLADAIGEAKLRAGLAERDEVEVRIPEQSLGLGDIVTGLTWARRSELSAWRDLATRMHAWEARPLALLPMSYEVRR